jgi:lysozyme
MEARMTRPIPKIAFDFIRQAEAMRLTGYADSTGVATIGVGHTGADVRIGMTITQAQSDAWLAQDLVTAAARLAIKVDEAAILRLADHQYAALLSFAFNLGVGGHPPWAIWTLLNAGRLDLIPDQIRRFDKAMVNGQLTVVPGLDHRRLAEVALWNTADAAAAVAVIQAAPVAPPPSSQTRAADTPPTPPPVKPLARSKSFAASAATAAAATASAALPLIEQASGGVRQVSAAIAPYADGNDLLGRLQQGLTLALAALAVSTVVFLWLKHARAKAA